MSDAISRRTLLKNGAVLAGGAAGFAGLAGAPRARASSHSPKAPNNGGYGPLSPTRDLTTGEFMLSLPAGFSYRSFGAEGTIMSDGTPTPPRHDGMGAFKHPANRDWVILMRNHERNPGTPFASPGYAVDGAGGVVKIVYDVKRQQVVESFPVLAGTIRNCGGSPTPWGTWLSCQETNWLSPDGKQHGWVFEVPISATGLTAGPQPVRALGLMEHEAAPVDPRTGIVYLTEDVGPCGFYRFVPKHYGRLNDGGVLQMLAIKGRPHADLNTGQTAGRKLPVSWVTIDDPTPTGYAGNPIAVWEQGDAKGGAAFVGGEGAAWVGDGVVFAASPGGDAALGQIWKYSPNGGSGGTLELLFESADASVLDGPDNIGVAPNGAVIIAEDGEGVPATVDNFIKGLTSKGQIFELALNLVPSNISTEFSGPTFSPDGSTFFCNLLGTAVSFAITGPWHRGAFGSRDGC